MRAPPIVAAIVLATAGCRGTPIVPDDAGSDALGGDAGPPFCLRGSSPGEPLPDPAACGLCMEAHAVLANPYGLTPGRATHAEGVPGGVLVLFENSGLPRLTFIDELQRVFPNPILEERAWSAYDHARIAAVPDSTRVWVNVRHVRDAQLFLFDYRGGEWRELAYAEVSFDLNNPFATTDGDLVGPAYEEGIGFTTIARVTADAEGAVRIVERTVDELGVILENPRVRPIDANGTNTGWALSGGLAALVVEGRPATASGAEAESWLVVVDHDLAQPRPPALVGASAADPRFDPSPVADQASVLRTGESALLMFGRAAGAPVWERSHYWLAHVDATGSIVEPMPGLWVNDGFAGDGRDAFSRGVVLQPDGDMFAAWAYYPAGSNAVESVQGFHADGAPVWPSPRGPGPISPLSVSAVCLDGAGRAFCHESELWEDAPPPPPGAYPRRTIQASAWTEELERGWTRDVQQCDTRTGEESYTSACAWEDGVWIIWGEEQQDHNGTRGLFAKAALVRSDGSFAW